MKISSPYKKYSTLLLSLILAGHLGFSQDMHFSQFFEAPLLRNPSLAGIFTGDYRIQGVYRDQWNSFTNAYRTGSFNGEFKMPIGNSNDFLTTGVQILYDKAGTAGLTTNEFLPALNYHKSLSDLKASYLSLGFMGGYVEKRIDRTKITTNNQYDGSAYNPSLADGETFPTPAIHYWDGSVGMSFNETFGADQQNSLFLGAAYHHLNRPRNSFYQNAQTELEAKYVFSVGMKVTVDEYSYFTLQADQSIQGAAKETIGGAMYSHKLGDFPDAPQYIVSLGAFLRWKDAFIPVLKLDMMPLAISISYDVNVSPLETVSQGRGGVEISMSYTGFLERDNSAKYKVLCPRF
jgi:type IX secretion system PorP/SprF family membrane protein